jgi:hypothetical protein
MSAAPTVTREVLELDIAAQQAAYEQLEKEWQEGDRLQAERAKALKAQGELLMRLGAQLAKLPAPVSA